MNVIMGIDPSQTGLGYCIIPEDWDLEAHRLVFGWIDGGSVKKTDPWRMHIERNMFLASQCVKAALDCEVTHVWMEMSLTRGAFNVMPQARLAGYIEHALVSDCDLFPQLAHPSTVRKFLLGRLPTGKGMAKTAVFNVVRELAPISTTDEADAFAIANWGLSELGLVAYAKTA